MKKKKKRSITLLEIMIVIFLIGLIGSVIGFNMKGSMDKGRAFKTERAQEQIKDILELQLAEGVPPEKIVADPAHYLDQSGMVKDPEKMLVDGWNEPFDISHGRDGIKATSAKLNAYYKKQKNKSDKKSEAAEDQDESSQS